MRNRSSALLFALLSMWLPLSLAAQVAPGDYRLLGPVLDVSPEATPTRISVRFVVRSALREPVDSPGMLRVTVREGAGQETPEISVPIELDPPGAEGIAWALAIDTSGSMRRLLPGLRDALADFVRGLGEQDQVALVTINDRATVAEPFTADKAKVETTLRALETSGVRTELYAGIAAALEQLDRASLPPTRVLILVSDGLNENKTSWKLDDGIEKARKIDALVAAICISGPDPAGAEEMRRLAEKSDGVFLEIDRSAPWNEKLEVVRRHTQAFWRASWDSRLPTDGSSHPVRLDVEVVGGLGGGSTELSAMMPKIESPEEIEQKRQQALRRQLLFWGGVAGGVVLLALVAWVASRSGRRRREELAKLQQTLESERERQEAGQAEIQSMLTQARAKIEGIETRVGQPPQAAATGSGAAARETTAPVAAKRRTVFQSGGGPAVPTYRRAWLEVTNGPRAGSQIPLPEGRLTVGRDDDNHLVLDVDRVSLHHAAITCTAGSFWLQDLGSTNGTFVGEGVRVTGPLALVDGMVIHIGGLALLFHGEE